MEKYRKKPLEIEALQFTHITKDQVYFWALSINHNVIPTWDSYNNPIIKIPTLEGVMICSYGDYLIKGVAGELYPCKPEIFEATYEKVEDEVH